jgi:dynein heavy chain 1
MWTRRFLTKFCGVVQENIDEYLSLFVDHRKTLEGIQHYLYGDMGEVAQAVVTIDKIQNRRQELEEEVAKLVDAEKTLKRYRYALPDNWVSVSQVETEWSSVKQALDKRVAEVEAKMPSLRSKVLSQDSEIQNSCKHLSARWAQEQPNTESLEPEHALGIINKFEMEIEKLHSQWENLVAARHALEIPTNSTSPVAYLKRDISSLKEVWSSLSSICSEMKDVDDSVWSEVDVSNIKQSLRGMLKRMSSFSSATQQYEAFSYVKKEINERLELLSVIDELKGDMLEERHWSRLCHSLGIPVEYANSRSRQSLPLGTVFTSLREVANARGIVNSVVANARGEHTLAEFLREIRSHWDQLEFQQTTSKDSGLKVINNFSEITEVVEDDLSGIESMEQSPYYSTFAGDVHQWKERLEQLFTLITLLEDAQRKWIYLGSLFKQNSSGDLQAHLPREFARFRSIDSELLGILNNVLNQGYVQSLLGIEDAEHCLIRLIDSIVEMYDLFFYRLNTLNTDIAALFVALIQ